jgi:serine/threonine protein kinase
MVWPPPKILAPLEGEPSTEARGRPASLPPSPAEPATAQRPVAEPRSGNRVPFDWLDRPEGLIGAVLDDRYRLTSVLGRGPMGIACEGESSRGRQVTVKLLPRPPEMPVEHFAWQVRQTLALAHFDHGNVSPITDFGTLDDGNAFVSRSRVPGVTLRTMLRQGALPLRRALDIGSQVAAALGAAHAQEIAHGRLKPENIIVQGGVQSGDLIKVVDFGMAELRVNLRAVAPNEDEARRFALRTLLYLPPNELLAASPGIDVYSLGVLLFEMIAGQPPFLFESIGAHGPQTAPLDFAQYSPGLQVPAPVSDLVRMMLHPLAAQHGISADQVARALNGFLGRPSIAPPPTPPEPITSQRESAPSPVALSLEPPPTLEGSAPDLQGPQTPRDASPFWPGSGNPAAPGPIWPTLPPGFINSSVPPPPAREQDPPSYPPPSAGFGVAPGTYPPTLPPQLGARSPSLAPPSPAPLDLDSDADADFRPSLIGRLKRLFGRKRDSNF